MKKLLLGLGAATAVIAPLASVVACGSNKQNSGAQGSNVEVIKDDSSKIDQMPAYSLDSLKAESLKIGWTDEVWKNGYTCESISQGINLLINLAKQEGWNMEENMIKDNRYIIDDSMTSMTVDEILAKWNVDLNSLVSDDASDEDKTASIAEMRQNIDALKSIVAKSNITDADVKAANLTGGNQTLDNQNDLTRSGTEIQAPKTPEEVFALSSGKWHTVGWYENKSQYYDVDNNLPALPISRIIKVDQLASQYPKISPEYLSSEIKPVIKVTIQKFISDLKEVIPVLAATGMVSNAFAYAVQYLFEHNSHQVLDKQGKPVLDDYGQPKIVIEINDEEFTKAIEALNETRSINWLAVKALYYGFDSSFTTGEAFRYVNDNFSEGSQIKGLKDDSGMNIVVGYPHRKEQPFNPVKSIAENIQENKFYELPIVDPATDNADQSL